jgi:MFS family permease
MQSNEIEVETFQEKTPWPRVFLFVGAGIVTAFQVGKAPPVLPIIRAEFGMSLFFAGWILSIFNVIGLISGSITGVVADAFGHRRLLLWGFCLQIAGCLVGSLSGGPVLLLVTRIFEGIGFLVIATSGPALIFRATQPKDLRLALSLWSSFLPAGAAIIMFATPLIVGFLSWRALWQINAMALIFYAILVARKTKYLATQSRPGEIRLQKLIQDLKLTATSLGPVLLALIFGAYTMQWFAMMGFLPTMLIEDQGLSMNRAAVLTAITVALNVPGNLMGGWLLQRGFRRSRLIASANLIMGLCSLAIYSQSLPFWMQYSACLFFTVSGGLLPASVLGGAPVYAPNRALVATTTGLIMQGSQLGHAMGPPVLAVIVSSFGGWHAAPLALGSAAVVGLFLSWVLATLERQKERFKD